MAQEAEKLVSPVGFNSFNAKFSNSAHSVLLFYTSWHESTDQLRALFSNFSKDLADVTFFMIDAEVNDNKQMVENFGVSSVPTLVFTVNGKVKEKLDMIPDVPALVAKVNKFNQQASTQQNIKNAMPDKGKDDEKCKLEKRLFSLINSQPVMLFMKGTPSEPKCKFSRQMIQTLTEQNVTKFGYFDILTDNSVRQGLKTFSNWKTYPQFYVNGELIGGLDIVNDMIKSNEFQDILPKLRTKEDELNARLERLTTSADIMLFMKGSPKKPQCGFSQKMCALLESQGIKSYGHFDVLSDNEIRQGLKKFSNWPTYPQLYISGSLVGGLDVVSEMIENGEFKAELKGL